MSSRTVTVSGRDCSGAGFGAARGRTAGLDHLGIQVEDKDELNDVYARLHKASGDVIEQGQTNCCYAKSEKSWVEDPTGISWETFLTTGESTIFCCALRSKSSSHLVHFASRSAAAGAACVSLLFL